jgi:uridine phosphorylase
MREEWIAAGVSAVDLETAPVFAMAERHGLAAAAALVVAETAGGLAADEEAVREALMRLGGVAVRALAPSPVTL